ncbi:MAG TPA: hypothetical protein VIE37_01570 [Methylomirabilota bacterium]|jgi:hypothetical protein
MLFDLGLKKSLDDWAKRARRSGVRRTVLRSTRSWKPVLRRPRERLAVLALLPIAVRVQERVWWLT